MANRMIWVTFDRIGFHYYEEAQTDPSLAEIAYLGSVHRHKFKFKVSIEVFHDDREIEFHQFLNYCESLFDRRININGKSVEMLADDLYNQIAHTYPNRDIIIDISEDGECGCSISYPKESHAE